MLFCPWWYNYFYILWEMFVFWNTICKFADNGADKLMTSRIALFGMSQAFSSIELPGMLLRQRGNRYVIDVGLVDENISTVSSPRGNNDRWLDRAESSFKACRDPACVLVDFIRETFAPLLPVQRSESASYGKIAISSSTDDMFFVILFSNILIIENCTIYSRILFNIFVI